MVIYPESFSIRPDTEATVGFRNLFNTTSQNDANKNLTLMTGNYVFQSKNADVREMYISNTIGVKEYDKNKAKNLHRTAIFIENVKNMEIDCCDSNFIMDGKMSHIVMKNCENIKLKNLNIEVNNPNVHKITILKTSTFYVTFQIDESSKCGEENGNFYWYGTDYKLGFTDYKNSGGWMVTAKPENLSHIKRNSSHPIFGVASIKQVTDRVFNARFIAPKDIEVGQVFYIYPAIREEVGILIDSCKNITLENVRQRFNYSLAVVAQNSKNITLDRVDFSPNPKAEVDFCSFADFMQFSMCRGKIIVKDSNFDAAGDDACNVHGFHFKIVEADKNRLTVKFGHPQSYGFECFREGDVIAFIDTKTLLQTATAKVVNATLRDKYYYDIEIDTYNLPINVGDAIENISACPDFEFTGNTINRIVTRGILVTTRGKVLIENNKFLNTGASGILISDDASDWYESGMVQDVTISGNAFINCEENAILIKPENRKYAGPVHRNITIKNNLFILNNIHAVNVSSSDNILLQDNVYRGKAPGNQLVISRNCSNLVRDY